ncbi:MAG: cytochrome c biogenesis protein/redoxin [Filifactor alocis]|nr:cytochrome c biogenesis protein/redoxin [Filifactor alocis]
MNQVIQVENISFVLVFLEGIISFFSPCVLPILPIYFGMMAGQDVQENKSKSKLNMLFFGLGIVLSFFLLAVAFTMVGQFFNEKKMLFSRIGGIIIILLGLYQVGFYKSNFLNKERRLPVIGGDKEIGPLVALVMGFTFSFAWTPCVGPMLSSVLIMASGAKTAVTGNLLVAVYALGFMIPFFLFGIFTQKIMGWLEKNPSMSRWIPKVGGVILILMGISVFTGWMNSVTGYLSKTPAPSVVSEQPQESLEAQKPATEEAQKPDAEEAQKPDAATGTEQSGQQEEQAAGSQEEEAQAQEEYVAPDFSGADQYGTVHNLADYKGKVILLNFWASWCGPCQREMPDVEALYHEYGENKNDVIILGVTNTKNAQNPNSSDIDEEEMKAFLKKGNYAFPSILNSSGDMFGAYGISAFPTTFIIDGNGTLVGYAQGMLTKEIMQSAIEDARAAKKN